MYRPARPYWPHSAPEPVETEAPRPTFGPCEGPCNSQYRRAMNDYAKAIDEWGANGYRGAEPAEPDMEPWPGDPVFCRRCTWTIRGALRDLPLAYDALKAVPFLTRSASADEERRGRSDVPPSPSPGADQQDLIVRLASSWEDVLRQHLRHVAATDAFGSPWLTLDHAVEYLNANYAEIIEHPDFGADFGNEILSAHRTVVAMVKNKPVRKQLPPPCPTCDVTALIQEEGIVGKPWYVECSQRLGGCGRLFSESEFDWLTQLLTGGHVQSAVAA